MNNLLSKSLKLILNNEPIIVPTDTVYGLVCKYNSPQGVKKIYKLKQRKRKKPLILLGYDWKSLKKFVMVKDAKSITKFIKKYWPGAITLILPASKAVPQFLNKGLDTIGLRIPDNKFLLKLLNLSPGKVLASTSANISGMSYFKPQSKLAKKVKLFIKAKKNEMSLIPSKIIEVKKKKVRILR